MDRVEDGSVLLTANEFPSFLYETGTRYDENNEDLGLFRGFLLVRVRICDSVTVKDTVTLPYCFSGVSTHLHWPIDSDEPFDWPS